ncbi:hypothetical protein ACFL1Q_00465 [Patescibacteria group bacterium]
MTKSDLATKKDLKVLREDIKKEVKSIVLETEVKVLGELKEMREEFDAHQFSHIRINDDLQEHDKRIKTLETSTV